MGAGFLGRDDFEHGVVGLQTDEPAGGGGAFVDVGVAFPQSADEVLHGFLLTVGIGGDEEAGDEEFVFGGAIGVRAEAGDGGVELLLRVGRKSGLAEGEDAEGGEGICPGAAGGLLEELAGFVEA